MSKKKRVATNILVSTLSQVITLALGMILPRLILTNWGSEYNGLINSITSIMRYLALLEAGISTSTLQALYKSLGQDDKEKTSVIVKSSQSYYRRVAFVYAALVCVISFIYPLFLKTGISYYEIVIVILLQGLTGVINFAFRASYQQLLNAEGRFYVVSIVSLITTILTYAAKIISVIIFDSIIIMQVLGVFIMCFQVIVYAVYFNRRYGWIDKKVTPDMSLLENRKYYLVQQVAGLVFNSTDTIVLSVFCGLSVASVYGVYNMIFSAIAILIGIVRSSTNFVLGQAYHENKRRFELIYKTYTSFQVTLGCYLSSCCILLIIGFVRLYTRGVTDANYVNFIAAILFCLNIMLDCSRGASLTGANVAGKAPNTTWRYIVEAGINLAVSLILVNIIGMNGVLIGTIVAGIWRSIDSIVYFNKNVLNKSPLKEFIFVGTNYCLFFIVAAIAHVYSIELASYGEFIKQGILISVLMFFVFGTVFVIANWEEFRSIVSKTIKRI